MDVAEPPRIVSQNPTEVRATDTAPLPPLPAPAPASEPQPAPAAAAPPPAAPAAPPPATSTDWQTDSERESVRLARLAAAQREKELAGIEEPALELGAGAFLMVGGGAGGYAGVTPFLVDEVAPGFYLRPAVAVGSSVATHVGGTWAAARVDACARLPGRYVSRNGLQLDLCAGPDVGVSYVSSGTLPGTPPEGKTLPYVSLGPSVDLQGEIGGLAILLRGVIGVDVASESYVDVTGAQVGAPVLSWRLELDFSWALRR